MPERDFEPDHAPAALQAVALVLDQDNVAAAPGFTVDGVALIETVGGGTTVTLTLRLVVPLGPVQASANVVVTNNGTVCSDPVSALLPDHPPVALQLVAPALVQVSVVVPFCAIELGARDNETVGAAHAMWGTTSSSSKWAR